MVETTLHLFRWCSWFLRYNRTSQYGSLCCGEFSCVALAILVLMLSQRHLPFIWWQWSWLDARNLFTTSHHQSSHQIKSALLCYQVLLKLVKMRTVVYIWALLMWRQPTKLANWPLLFCTCYGEKGQKTLKWQIVVITLRLKCASEKSPFRELYRPNSSPYSLIPTRIRTPYP